MLCSVSLLYLWLRRLYQSFKGRLNFIERNDVPKHIRGKQKGEMAEQTVCFQQLCEEVDIILWNMFYKVLMKIL